MPFLELKNVSKGYGPEKGRTEVLRDINLTVARGEFVAIVGYSGAGKTTLISMIAGLLRPDAGTVTVDGKIVTSPGPERALVFQNYSLLPWLSVYENVHLAVEQDRPRDRKAINHDPRFKAIRNQVIGYLTGPGKRSDGGAAAICAARAPAPNLKPIDFANPRRFWQFRGRGNVEAVA